MSLETEHIKPGDILVLTPPLSGHMWFSSDELARFIVLKDSAYGPPNVKYQVYTLYTLATHPINTPTSLADNRVGSTQVISRAEMINDSNRWSKL